MPVKSAQHNLPHWQVTDSSSARATDSRRFVAMSVGDRSAANPEYRNITRTKFAYSNENVRKDYNSAGPQYARNVVRKNQEQALEDEESTSESSESDLDSDGRETLRFPSSVTCSQAYTAVRRFPRPVPCQHRPYASPSAYPPGSQHLVTPATQPRAPLRSPASAPSGARAIPRTPTPSAFARRPPPAARTRRVVSASSLAPSPRLFAVLPSSLPPSHATQRAASPLSHPVQWPLPVQLRVPQKVDARPSRLECLQRPCAIFSHTIGWSCARTSAWAAEALPF
ncbi:hypothetical protein DFH08DRAFT_1084948 [Mycena albidolilacea]|uniref:Uncharacterized protein n=1 Tax=Mycena albidolilacea TaxID=1033008 RepID=A0AAD7EJF5_9AGAR|nr:hypothetical protein DFH08DRAFT_1084948 [Mycena albidolilacea]